MKLCLIIAFAVGFTICFAQQPTQKTEQPEVPTLDAAIGPCTADFYIKDSTGHAIYAAKIHTLIRYGAFGVRKQDLELSTNYDGRARITGLPDVNKRPTEFDIRKGDLKAVVSFDPGADCHPKYEITLK
jgi:hypothetical protein